MAVPTAILDLARPARRIAVLTGAGMSAESGVPTFRDAQTGLWENFDAASLATPEAWNDDPPLVWAWYQWRVGLVRRVTPNAGHLALSEWGRRADLQITTQNVDDLHERAGSAVLAHLHGSLFEPRCADCEQVADVPEPPENPVERLDPPRAGTAAGSSAPASCGSARCCPSNRGTPRLRLYAMQIYCWSSAHRGWCTPRPVCRHLHGTTEFRWWRSIPRTRTCPIRSTRCGVRRPRSDCRS